MAYRTIIEMNGSLSLRDRIVAAVAQELPDVPGGPGQAVDQYMWKLVARPDWVTKWEQADRSLDFNPDLGDRPSVITDAMILTAIRAVAAG